MANDQYHYAPRGLGRIEACRYLGLTLGLFDSMVSDGRLPPPKKADKRHIWDRVALDVAFASLPDQEQDTRSRAQKLIDAKAKN